MVGAQTARRPWSARISVTSSAYSRSPPTGRPTRDPGDAADDRLQPLGQVHRGRLPFQRRVGGEDHLLERRAVTRGLVGALQQLADAQPLGADAVDRRDRAVEDVVEALELGRALEREDVERLFHDAQPALVPAAVATDRAQLLVADVEAALAEDDLVADVDEGRRQRPRFGVGRAEQVVGQALRGLRADAGQAPERFDEPRDGLDEEGRHAPVTSPGS